MPRLYELYSYRDDIEIVCMDDHSTDQTGKYLRDSVPREWKGRVQIYSSCRKTDEYQKAPAEQHHYLIDRAKGEFLILQCAEIFHINDMIKNLKPYCNEKEVSFATTINTPYDEEFFKYLYNNKIQSSPPIFEKENIKANGFTGKRRTRNCILSSGQIIPACTFQKIYKIKSGKNTYKKIKRVGKQRPMYVGKDTLRPLFFCGMLKKETWYKAGGYPNRHAPDRRFGWALERCGYIFNFPTDTLAIHIQHEKY